MSKIFIYSGSQSPTLSDLWQEVSTIAGGYLGGKAFNVEVLSRVDRRLYLDRAILQIFGERPCDPGLERHVDCGTLCVHVGHGEKDRFWAGNLGNEPVFLRWLSPSCSYFFMVSCLVLAHGDFPWNDPVSAQLNEPSHANAFARWGRALNEKIRMVGGGASSIWVSPQTLANAFKAATDQAFPIADSFILATSTSGRISSCLARGYENPIDTPLCTDRAIKTGPNPVGRGRFLHLQYPQWTAPTAGGNFWRFYERFVDPKVRGLTTETPVVDIPGLSPPAIICLQRLDQGADPSGAEEALRDHVAELPDGSTVVGRRIVPCGLECARIQPEGFLDQGSIEIWRKWVIEATKILGESFMHFSSAVAGLERGVPYSEDLSMMIDRAPAKGATDGDVVRYAKCEMSYLQPRIVATNTKGRALLPVLDFDCLWWARLSPVQIDGRNPIPIWEADISAGGFNIVAVEPEFEDLVAQATIVSFELPEGKLRSLLFAEGSWLLEEYDLSKVSARPGYRLVSWQGREWLLLVYRVSVPPKEHAEVAGLQLDIPAFKVTEGLRPLVEALDGGISLGQG